jgi:hypothetical protein
VVAEGHGKRPGGIVAPHRKGGQLADIAADQLMTVGGFGQLAGARSPRRPTARQVRREGAGMTGRQLTGPGRQQLTRPGGQQLTRPGGQQLTGPGGKQLTGHAGKQEQQLAVSVHVRIQSWYGLEGPIGEGIKMTARCPGADCASIANRK